MNLNASSPSAWAVFFYIITEMDTRTVLWLSLWITCLDLHSGCWNEVAQPLLFAKVYLRWTCYFIVLLVFTFNHACLYLYFYLHLRGQLLVSWCWFRAFSLVQSAPFRRTNGDPLFSPDTLLEKHVKPPTTFNIRALKWLFPSTDSPSFLP